MEFRTDPTLIDEMKRLREKGGKSAAVLRFLSEHGIGPGGGAMFYFYEAFSLRFADVTAIGGWTPDGTGELSDDRIDALIDISQNNI